MSEIAASSLRPAPSAVQVFTDVLLVAAVSVGAYALEEMARSAGWLPLAPEAAGVSGVLAGAAAAVLLVLARGGRLADLGFRQPARWSRVPLQVLLIFIAFAAMQTLAPLLVSAFTEVPQPDLSRYDSVRGNAGAAVTMFLILPLTASIPEEIIYRGFLVGRLADLFSGTRGGAALAVCLQACVFGAVHFAWGFGGMLVTAMMGLVWGSAYLLCGRNLWVVIIAHSVGHLLLVIQLYLGESIVV